MDVSPVHQSSPRPFFLSSPSFFSFPSYATTPWNYVHWTETAESHLYTADLPGVRKEEIRVEVEDSLYMVIRTEAAMAAAEEGEQRRSFMRKFRLPRTVDVDGISARYDAGVLTVTVPRSYARGRLRIHPQDVAEAHNSVARAA